MSTLESSQVLIERALQTSTADGCVVISSDSTEANLRWANNTLTTNGVARSRTVTVVSVIGESAGVTTRQGVTTIDQVLELLAASEGIARDTAASEDANPLIDAGASFGDWDGKPAEASTTVFNSFAPDLGASFERADRSDQRLYGYASYDMTTTFVGTSTGLRSRHDQPTGYLEVNAKSADLARSTWAGVATSDFTDVHVPKLHDDLERRLGWAARHIDLPPGHYDTILPPTAVADLMINLYWSADGRDSHDGRTVFSRPGGGTRVGDRLSPSPLTLSSDAGADRIECSPFAVATSSGGGQSVFDNGSTLTPTKWISDGVLEALVQTRFTSALTGLPYTPYIDNLILESAAPAGQLDDIVAGTERGLLLTCLWYIREVDPQTLLLTGLTRDGVFMVEGGEVTGAVNNFRFNESPVGMLERASVVGNSERALPREWSDYFTRTIMPPMRVEGFNMSSVSQAS